ncbi:uncharacterized protein LOC144232235 [Crocuta crocuta]
MRCLGSFGRTMTRCCRQRIRNGKTTWGPEDREEAAAIGRGDGSVRPGLIPHTKENSASFLLSAVRYTHAKKHTTHGGQDQSFKRGNAFRRCTRPLPSLWRGLSKGEILNYFSKTKAVTQEVAQLGRKTQELSAE